MIDSFTYWGECQMNADKIGKILYSLISAIGIAFFVLLLLIPIFLVLINQGWQHPFQSLQAKAEMRTYLEETYPEQNLHIGFPAYNMIMDDFSTFVKGEDGQVLFGLIYDENRGVTEHAAFQARDGSYCLTIT